MTSLCVDTATENGLIAIADGESVLAAEAWRSSSRHGENLFARIDRALSRSGVCRDAISAIGVGLGPGKFTSLRVGLSTAKGLALGLETPIVGVSSLRVRARSVGDDLDAVRVALLDAYRGDVFAAAYVFEGGALQEIVPPTFGSPEAVLREMRRAVGAGAVVACGEGATRFRATVDALNDGSPGMFRIAVETPTAVALASEVASALQTRGPDDLAALEPEYLRPSDARLPQRPLRAPDEA